MVIYLIYLYSRLEHLSVPSVIDRLVLRRLFGLAIEICQFLRLPESEGANRILAHWARYKVKFTSCLAHQHDRVYCVNLQWVFYMVHVL